MQNANSSLVGGGGNVGQISEFRHKVSNPIEALSNLIYLTQHEANDPDKVILYMSLADEALKSITNAVDALGD
jgi:hypothetical protein